MIVTDPSTRNQTAQGLIEGDVSLAAKLQANTVLLRAGQLTGSGVIYAWSKARREVYILTAKHNVLLYAESHKNQFPRNGLDNQGKFTNRVKALDKHFRDNTEVHWGGLELTISAIVYFGGASWDYDVCCLVIDDNTFYREVTKPWSSVTDFSLTPNDNPDYGTIAYNEGDIFTQLGTRTNDDIQNYAKTTLNGSYHFFMTGFGARRYSGEEHEVENVDGDSTGTFGYRLAALANSWATAYNVDGNQVDKYEDVMVLAASAEDTSAKGDSGGPVFAINKDVSGRANQLDIYLVGVTLGGNMHRQQNNAIHNADVYQNNTATMLSRAFKKQGGVEFGGGQNAVDSDRKLWGE